MPQEISLYDYMTLQETFLYFGTLTGMSWSQIKKRTKFLVNLLDLTALSSRILVGSMSGGQKRRVSLGAALIHQPPLLLLDEPTVGVDPLLRKSIWQHLVDIVDNSKVSDINLRIVTQHNALLMISGRWGGHYNYHNNSLHRRSQKSRHSRNDEIRKVTG